MRLTFPSLSQNSSPLSIMPSFLEVLGRKIDNCEDVVDSWLISTLLQCIDIVGNSAWSLQEKLQGLVSKAGARAAGYLGFI